MKPLLILLAAATAGQAYPGLPPFLGILSREAQETYRQITDDNMLTVNQVRDKLAAWAKKYNVSKELHEFFVREDEDWKKTKNNVENLLEEMSTLYKQILKIRENKNKTIADIENEVEEIRLRNSTLFEITSFAERQFDRHLQENHLNTRVLSNGFENLFKGVAKGKRSARGNGKRKGRRRNGRRRNGRRRNGRRRNGRRRNGRRRNGRRRNGRRRNGKAGGIRKGRRRIGRAVPRKKREGDGGYEYPAPTKSVYDM